MTVDVEEAKAELIDETASQVRSTSPEATTRRRSVSSPVLGPGSGRRPHPAQRHRHELGIHLVVHPMIAARRAMRVYCSTYSTRAGTTPRAPSRSRSSTLRSTGRPITISSTSSKGDTERALADVRAAVDDWRPKREARWRSPSPGRGPTSAGCRLPPGRVQGLVLGVLQVRRARALSWVGVCHADS
jgi:hypothetical protein